MKPSSRTFTLFVLLSLVQLAIPLYMIGNREWTLRTGQVFKFQTAPVDPADFMRGRYVALRFRENSAPTGNLPVKRNQKVHVRLTVDPKGYAHFGPVSLKPPEEGAYITCKVNWTTGSEATLFLPFDRFYLNEKRAPQAEKLYRDFSRAGLENANTYVQVRVRSGQAVLENLFLNGKPIQEYFKQH